VTQHQAVLFRERYPDRVQIVRAEDVMADPLKTLGAVCEHLGLRVTESLRTPSWNGLPLVEVYPWGTIRVATTQANRSTALELTGEERADLRARTRPFLDVFDYQSFV